MASYFRLTVLLIGLAVVVASSSSKSKPKRLDDIDMMHVIGAVHRHLKPRRGHLDKRQGPAQETATVTKDACGSRWAIPEGGQCPDTFSFFEKFVEISEKYDIPDPFSLTSDELRDQIPWGAVKELAVMSCVTVTPISLNCEAGRCVCGNSPPPCPPILPDVNLAECEARAAENSASNHAQVVGRWFFVLSFVVVSNAVAGLYKN